MQVRIEWNAIGGGMKGQGMHGKKGTTPPPTRSESNKEVRVVEAAHLQGTRRKTTSYTCGLEPECNNLSIWDHHGRYYKSQQCIGSVTSQWSARALTSLKESFDHEAVAAILKGPPLVDGRTDGYGLKSGNGREETMEHLFLTCDVAMHLWRSSPWGFYPICDTGIRVWDWVKFIWDLNSRGVLVKDAFLYASIIVDTIWRVRNDKVHNNRLVDVKKCIDDIYFVYADLKDTLFSSPTSHLEETWSPPPRDWIKLNCDVKVGFDNMCVAVVARNHLGAVIEVRTARVEFSDALCGEAEACCLAISTALELGYKFIIIENNSRVVINALNGLEPRWAIENYVSFCTKSSQSFISCNFSFIKRTCNFAAHNVARWAFAHHIFGSIPVSMLPENLLCNDREV
uniref:RNase H type-1 domain-containing protein n=1 Tax=Cannabis sativa TaxID=3483 RepID=A0A803NKH1_CANSA